MTDVQETIPGPGTVRTSAYYEIIGPAPECGPANFASALAYTLKIESAINRGGWTPYESTRLYKLRAKWARRATGKDARYNVVGTAAGRLPADVEYKIGRGRHGRGSKKDTPHPHFIDPAHRRDTFKTYETEEQLQAWEDADLPRGRAKGTGASVDPDHDVFEPESGEIALPTIAPARQYLIPGQDTKGHAHRIYCRVMPAHFRAICAIQDSKAFGFRTTGDVLRWCVDHGVRELNTRTHIPQAKSAVAQADAIRRILLDEQYYMDYSVMFEAMTAVVNRHLSAGAEQEATRLIAHVRYEIEQMGEKYWRDKYMAELMRHYGSYLDGSRGKAVEFGDSE